MLLGFGLLGILGWDSVRVSQDFGWFAYAPESDGQAFLGVEQYLSGSSLESNSVVLAIYEQGHYPMRDWLWPVLVMVTLVATVGWYSRRAGGSVRRHVALALGGGVAVLVGYVAVGIAAAAEEAPGLVSSVGLPLLVLGGVAGAWVLLRLGPGRRAAAMISVGCLVVGVGTVLGVLAPGLYEPVIIAAGLFALARFERSRLLAIVAGMVLVVMMMFPVGTMSMLLPAAVALAGGVVALVRQGDTPAPA